MYCNRFHDDGNAARHPPAVKPKTETNNSKTDQKNGEPKDGLVKEEKPVEPKTINTDDNDASAGKRREGKKKDV